MDAKDIKDAAELEVRRYFDHFLENVHPKIMSEHINSCAHGKLFNKFKWIMVGMCISFGIVAPTISVKLLSLIKKLIMG